MIKMIKNVFFEKMALKKNVAMTTEYTFCLWFSEREGEADI